MKGLQRKHFNDPVSYLAWYRHNRQEARGYASYGTRPELGEAILETGTTKYNTEIQEYAKQIWENVPSLKKSWQPAVIGAFPNVPAFLGGELETMWRMKEDYSEHTPVRIWIGVTSSWGVERSDLTKRGAVLSAFAQALSEIRTVYLTPYVNLGGYRDYYDRMSQQAGALISWDLTTSPLVMSEVAASLAESYVIRDLGIEACELLNPDTTGQWLDGYDDETKCRAMLGAKEDDLWLNSIHLHDELLTNPIEWVQRHLAKYAEARDAEMSW